MNLLEKLKARFTGKEKPEHLRRGELGEHAAKKHLQRGGLKFLTANFRSKRGEIDLVFRDNDCLAFIEVKTRSSEDWTRPAAAVDARKRRLLSQTALDYLRRLKNPAVKIRFDIVEVLLADGQGRNAVGSKRQRCSGRARCTLPINQDIKPALFKELKAPRRMPILFRLDDRTLKPELL